MCIRARVHTAGVPARVERGREGGACRPVLRPLGGCLPDARIEKPVAHRRREEGPQPVVEEARLDLGARLLPGELGQVVQIPVVQPSGQIAEVPLELHEVDGDPPLVQVRRLDGNLDDVAVAMQPLALALVVPEEVGRVVVGPNADRVHQWAASTVRYGICTSGGREARKSAHAATDRGSSIDARGGRPGP